MTAKKLLGALGALLVAGIAAYQSGGLEGVLRELPGELQKQIEGVEHGSQAPAPTPARPAAQARTNDVAAPAPVSQAEANADFDYYVLALSWSPSYCEGEGGDRGGAQCSGGRPYDFVVHGLWPQYERGWPDFCDVRARVPDDVIRKMLPVMPAKGLMFHQWKKHGTCTGLDPRDYFEKTLAAYNAVTIPEPFKGLDKAITVAPSVIEDAFIEANPLIGKDEMVVACKDRRLQEVRICFDKGLTPRRCGADAQRECRDRSVRMPPVR